MSKDISIKEGDLSRQFGHISKLNIANSGGGSSLWVPEEDVETKSLHVTKNGTYLADASYIKTIKTIRNGKVVYVPVRVLNEENSCYGFDEVSVDIIDNVNGYDDDGHYKNIGVGDNDYLVESRIPSYINIVKEPTTTHYVEGQDISIEGIQVKAYFEDDTEWGDVPFAELSFEPTVAVIGEKKAGGDDIRQGFPNPFMFLDGGTIIVHQFASGFWKTTYQFDCRAVGVWHGGYYDIGFASKTPATVYADCVNAEGKHLTGYPATISLSRYVVKGKPVYWAYRYADIENSGWIEGGVYSDTKYDFDVYYADYGIGYAMLYEEVDGGNNVTVKWDNEMLDESLTDTYEIEVGQGPIPPND